MRLLLWVLTLQLVSSVLGLSTQDSTTTSAGGGSGLRGNLQVEVQSLKSSRQFAVQQSNTVVYNGNTYSTLADVAVGGTGSSCQNNYLALPSGWSIAPDNVDSQTVIHMYPWNCDVVVVASGNSYGASRFTEGLWNAKMLYQSGSTYAAGACTLQILIIYMQQSNTVSYNGNTYSTLADVAVGGTGSTCQSNYLALPSGWSIAPDSVDSQTVIHMYPWNCDVVVVASGNSYGASRYTQGLWNPNMLLQSGSTYAAGSCTLQILIIYGAASPTAVPTVAPAASPTAMPTAVPIAVPTSVPTANPTARPTVLPTASPTAVPSAAPTAFPSAFPSAKPTAIPSAKPTAVPFAKPTAVPSAEPSANPSAEPSPSPSSEPTSEPTFFPSAGPSADPTAKPSPSPSSEPTSDPSPDPTSEPTPSPTPAPSAPTHAPTSKRGYMVFDYGKSTVLTAANFNCMRSNGFTYFIPRAYSTSASASGLDRSICHHLTLAPIQNVHVKGMFVSPKPGYGLSAYEPLRTVKKALLNHCNTYSDVRVWIQVLENGQENYGWFSDTAANQKWFEALLTSCHNHFNHCGVMTSENAWARVFGSSTYHNATVFSGVPLWYSNTGTPASYADFVGGEVTIGTWNSANMKQYSAVNMCGVTVGLDWTKSF
jgi:hypothetical protein